MISMKNYLSKSRERALAADKIKSDKKLTTSEQINDATQTRFIPDDVYDIRKDRPPLWSILTIPFQLLVCKILDIKDYFFRR
mgnify:FL=1